MQTFVQQYDKSDCPDALRIAQNNINEAHYAAQQLEAGVTITGPRAYRAFQAFNRLVGYRKGEFGRQTFVAAMYRILNASWPKIHITETLATAKDGSEVWHVSVRPSFHSSSEGILVNGSATCSHKSVALMQAYIRMLDAHVKKQMVLRSLKDKPVRPKFKLKELLRHTPVWETQPNVFAVKALDLERTMRDIAKRQPTSGFDPEHLSFGIENTSKPKFSFIDPKGAPKPKTEERKSTAHNPAMTAPYGSSVTLDTFMKLVFEKIEEKVDADTEMTPTAKRLAKELAEYYRSQV